MSMLLSRVTHNLFFTVFIIFKNGLRSFLKINYTVLFLGHSVRTTDMFCQIYQARESAPKTIDCVSDIL